MTAVVVGATGLVGSEVLRRALEKYPRVIAVTRRPTGLSHPHLDEMVVDFEHLPEHRCVCDVVFCALGTTIGKAGSQQAFRRVDHDYVTEVAYRALQCGAKRLALVSSVGADAGSSNFYLRTKGETESAVAAMPFEAVHILRPGLLLGQRRERRQAEGLAQTLAPLLSWALVNGLRRYRPIAAGRVAQAMLAAVDEPVRGVHTYEYDDINRLCVKTRC